MFVTFEGPEGGGKSTALAAVAQELRTEGLDVVTTREPGAGEVGGRIRELLLHSGNMDPKAELLLFLADRANHVETIIGPALERGCIVLCDRHADSTLVYQGFVRGLDAEFVRRGNEFATGRLLPELTLLFDIDVEEGLARLKTRDRLDSQPLAFHQAVRQGFLRLASEEPSRWVVLDASQSPETVFAYALGAVRNRMGRQPSLDL